MIKKYIGVLVAILTIATVVVVVLNRNSYSSMIFEDSNVNKTIESPATRHRAAAVDKPIVEAQIDSLLVQPDSLSAFINDSLTD